MDISLGRFYFVKIRRKKFNGLAIKSLNKKSFKCHYLKKYFRLLYIRYISN